MFNFKILKNEKEYEEALNHVLTLMSAKKNTKKEDELILWTLIIEEYEEKNYFIGLPDPIDAILFSMEQQQINEEDLIPFFGSKKNVSNILKKKKPLTLEIIQKLHFELGVPAEVLIQDYFKKGEKK
ncbi:MAG TPA: hypothetical protein VMZ91_01180 [Candidatus Paceibacterota bacterium]|nr:hypothetical protein [Candidatus Paceibacterota bacterium]